MLGRNINRALSDVRITRFFFFFFFGGGGWGWGNSLKNAEASRPQGREGFLTMLSFCDPLDSGHLYEVHNA